MTTMDTKRTVGALVTEQPARARVFEQYGIDYCCGGKTPLADACAAKGLDSQEVLDRIMAEDARQANTDQTDWSQATLSDLIDHIEQTHHVYLRRELPRLTTLTAKVREVHGANRPELVLVEEVFLTLQDELESHMMKEEQVLFPLIRQLEAADTLPSIHCGSVENPIGMMEHEHDNAGQALARLRQLTRDYEVPADACNTYRTMLSGLEELELDLHQHIHKENNILFPRASRREAELAR